MFDLTAHLTPDISWRKAGGAGAITPAFQADFTALSALPTGVSFSRATTGTYFDASGVLQTAAIDAPRFDHAWNGSAWVATGLMDEEQRTNVALQSQTLATTWNTDGASVTSDAATGPDGAATADKVIPSAATVAHDIYQPVTIVNGNTYTWSVYAKAAGYNFALISADGAAVRYSALVNLTTGALVSNPIVGSPSGTATKITAVGNGWYRIAVTMTTDTVASYFGIAPVSSSGDTINGDNNPVFLGDGTSGVLFFGAQLEAGTFATSYIPTTTAAVTRSADIPQLTGAALTAALASTGTLIAQIGPTGAAAGRIIGADVNQTPLYIFDNTTVASYDGLTGFVALVALPGGNTFQGNSNRVAVGWDATPGESLVGDGGIINTGNLALYGSGGITKLYLGSQNADQGFINTHFESLAIYTSRLSDADLQAKSVVGAAF